MSTKRFAGLHGFDIQKPLHAYLIDAANLANARESAEFVTRALMCEAPENTEKPCDVCRACKKCLAGTHPDVTVLGQGKVSVDDVRALHSDVYLAPNEGVRKVFMLQCIENFNAQSQNALLKVLEEPPEGVVFVLSTLSKSGILPTVLSRVSILTPSADSAEETARAASHLAEKCTIKSLTHEEKIDFFVSFLSTFGDTDEQTLDASLVGGAFEAAMGYFKGVTPILVTVLPKKREELLVYLRVFMLFADHIAVYKLSRGKRGMLPPFEAFRGICVRFSAKRAVEAYDFFEKAYLMTEDYANMNALFATLAK